MADSDLDLLVEAAVVHGQLAGGAKPSWVAARASDPRLVIVTGVVASSRNNPVWTADEDAFLRENLGRLSEAELAAHLGRTVNAIHMRWSNYKRLPAPSKDPRILTAHQIALGMGLDARQVRSWILRGLLAGHRIPGGDDTLVVERPAFLYWLTRSCNWPHFKPDLVDRTLPNHGRGGGAYDRAFWAKARRMLDLARERWGDEWLTTRQAGELLGVDADDIDRWIVMKRLPGVRLPNLDGRGRPNPHWAYWKVRRSHVLALPVKLGRGAGHEKPLAPAAAAFAVLAHAAGLIHPAIARLMAENPKHIDHQIRQLQRSGQARAIARAHRLPIQFNASGDMLADWKQLAPRLPALARAMRNFGGGRELSKRDRALVKGVLLAWCRFYGAGRIGRLTLLQRLQSHGINPFRPMRATYQQETTMNVTETARQVRDFTFRLSEQDLEVYLANPQAWADDVRAQLGAAVPATPNAAKGRGAGKKTAGPKSAGKKSAGKLKCPECPKTFKSQGFLDRHLEQKHGAKNDGRANGSAPAPKLEPAAAAG